MSTQVNSILDNIIDKGQDFTSQAIQKAKELGGMIESKVNEGEDKISLDQTKSDILENSSEVKNIVENKTEETVNTVMQNDHVANAVNKVDELKENASEKLNDAKVNVQEKLHDEKENVNEKLGDAKDSVLDKLSDARDTVLDKLNEVKDNVQEKFQDVADKVMHNDHVENAVDKAQVLKEEAQNKLNDAKDGLMGNEHVANAVHKAEELKDKAQDRIEESVDSVRDRFEGSNDETASIDIDSIDHILGKTVGEQTILNSNQEVLAFPGEVVTHELIESARAHNVLDQLLANVN